jgi:hypothetical protein
MKRIKNANLFLFANVEGGKLWVMMQGKNIVLKDENGGMAKVSIKNVLSDV